MKNFKEITEEANELLDGMAQKVKKLDDAIKHISETLLRSKETLNLTDEEFSGIKSAIIFMLNSKIKVKNYEDLKINER
jgi:hypothetical protein